jgi:hypothetical protein
LRRGTPSAGFALVCSLYRDVQLTSRASYARGLSQDPLKELSTVDTATGLNWKIGKSFLGDQSLTFNSNTKINSTPMLRRIRRLVFTATVQLNVARF